jgi:tetratricopeptide (TPR) repeat protein
MRYQHSFWYRESRAIFEEALKADPSCAIAYWGIGLSYLLNPHSPPPAANLPLGLAALQKAKAIGAGTQRERDFIDALLVFYTDHDKIPHGARVQAYLKAIESVAQRYPDDDEAQLFYGITLNVAASPNDKTYANQLKGAVILEKIFARQPRHPGVAHYLIHLYDTPALAEKGLAAARRYAEIAPAAPHAQHMPTHIFTRVGYWKESISSNSVAAREAKAEKEPSDELHALDYMVYAYLQLGQDAKTRQLAELRDKRREAKDAYWSEQVDIQWQVASAWLLYAEGKYDEALKAMSAAADAEDKTEKHPVTPGVPKPAREFYGMMLLERGMAGEALAAFEATLKKEPNRFNALAGAAQAAAMAGDKANAKGFYQKLLTLASAEADRPELATARDYIAKN